MNTISLTQSAFSLFIPHHDKLPERRFDLDWLRVIAFGLLILFHIGIMYVENWGWHIKSQYRSQSLENLMLLIEPWRMALLWFVSGCAIRFVLVNISIGRFIVMRSHRLLIPLFFAVLVIVPPQLYYEMTFNGELNMSYWEFYKQFFQSNSAIFKNYQPGIWPHIDVNHLWYIRELWLFSLYLIPLLPLLNSKFFEQAMSRLSSLNGGLMLLVFSLPIVIIQLLMGTDHEREVLGFTFMVYGYAIGWNSKIWKRIKQAKRKLLIWSIIFYALTVIGYNQIYLTEAMNENVFLTTLFLVIYGLDRVLWLLAILSFGFSYLNRRSAALTYLNQAVFPYYIVHQSVIIIIGFELAQLNLGPMIEPLCLVFSTIVVCALFHAMIKRVGILRPLFGLKINTKMSKKALCIGRATSAVLVSIIGLEILF
jgi:hypothetical protein